jgi:aminoglycoside 6'-N-acetyltransferase
VKAGPGGERTRLRPVTEHDLDLLAAWFAAPAFVEHWGGVSLTRAEVAEKYLGPRRPEVESYLILERPDDGPVGYIQYWRTAADARSGGIDMVLAPSAQGRGLGPDAASALAAHLCAELGWSRVTADPDAANERAVRAWRKAGFREVARDGSTVLMEYQSAADPSCPDATLPA